MVVAASGVTVETQTDDHLVDEWLRDVSRRERENQRGDNDELLDGGRLRRLKRVNKAATDEDDDRHEESNEEDEYAGGDEKKRSSSLAVRRVCCCENTETCGRARKRPIARISAE